MQLTGELKEKVEKAESKEEAKKILEEVGVELSDTELDQVSGGFRFSIDPYTGSPTIESLIEFFGK